jgi:dihydroneopterin aldolase
MYTVYAKGVKLRKNAGVYAEEKYVGNSFEVDISLEFEQRPHTIPDYVYLIQAVYGAADMGFEWLETWAENIIDRVRLTYPEGLLKIDIRKYTPIIEGREVGQVGLTMEHRPESSKIP